MSCVHVHVHRRTCAMPTIIPCPAAHVGQRCHGDVHVCMWMIELHSTLYVSCADQNTTFCLADQCDILGCCKWQRVRCAMRHARCVIARASSHESVMHPWCDAAVMYASVCRVDRIESLHRSIRDARRGSSADTVSR